MKDWKVILLSTNQFIENEYLDSYIELISKQAEINGYMENHHVIPVAYYKAKYNLDTRSHRHEAERYANADPANAVVLLSFADHCKAHWLLAKCTEPQLANASAAAFLRMIASLKNSDGQILLSRKTGLIVLGLTEEDYKTIQQQSSEVKTFSSRYWTPEQIQWLKTNRQKYSIGECAKYLGKTTRAVSCQCNVLGLKKVWHTEEDNQALLEYSKTHTAKECAVQFNTSEANIIKRWRELGFKKHTYEWTPEKDAWLRENDAKYTVAELAEFLGTSKTTVMGRRWTLGITRYERNT